MKDGLPMRRQYVWIVGAVGLVGSALGARGAPPAMAGAISGKVTYTGTPPKMKPIDMAKEPSCAAQHATPIMTETVVTGPGDAVVNAVIYISAGDSATTTPTEAVRYDQKGCQYIPHVLVMQVGQPLDIYNNHKTSHNIHPLALINPEWNKSQPPDTPPIHTNYAK